jgi:hypothetical protein
MKGTVRASLGFAEIVESGPGVLEVTSAAPGPDKDLPEDTRLWALLQQAGGGTRGGCVYDLDAIAAALSRTSQPT